MFHKNMKMQKSLTVAALIFLCTVLAGCTRLNKGQVRPTDSIKPTQAVTATPEPTATPTPEPTPYVDLPVDRITSEEIERSEEERSAMVVTGAAIGYNLNPFYCSTDEEYEIAELTQLKLLNFDEEGSIAAGIDKPCLAYDVYKLDTVTFEVTDPEQWEQYRIVLKDGLTFADGTPITADDVMFSVLTYAAKGYSGFSGLCNADICGMRAYHTQIPDEVREHAELAAGAGIDPDGTCPEDFEDKDLWDSVWGNFDRAGLAFAGDIITTAIENYGNDAFIARFLDPSITLEKIEADESLKVLYAMKIGGFVKSYDAETGIVTDFFGGEHELTAELLTVETYWELLKNYYGYYLSEDDGLNYERAFEDKRFEDYLAEIWCEENSGVDDIRGIEAGIEMYDDGSSRPCIDILAGSEEALRAIDIFVVEEAEYEEAPSAIKLTGAGKYTAESIDTVEGSVLLKANDNYPLGVVKQLYIRYMTEKPDAGDGELQGDDGAPVDESGDKKGSNE